MRSAKPYSQKPVTTTTSIDAGRRHALTSAEMAEFIDPIELPERLSGSLDLTEIDIEKSLAHFYK